MENKSKPIDRREFLRDLGMIGAASVFAATPWLSAFSEVEHTQKDKVRLAVIGPGSRGKFHLNFLSQNPKVEIVWLCDIYQPSLDSAMQFAPNAKTCKDYRKVLEDKTVDAVLIATPLDTHCEIACAAMEAGKDVLCEKSIGFDMDQCYKMYMTHKKTGKIFMSGQQRLFDPRYIKAMEMIHGGLIGSIQAIHSFWNRNGDWRRPCPDPSLEHLINWRLYKEHSKGLMTELACHQLQVGTWALQKFPEKVMGHGAISYWKDGREVYDNINLIYIFDTGIKMTYGSVISNKFYGLEEQIMGDLGTFEPEKGKYYFETVDPAPAFLQMINEWENKVFAAVPFAGTSWAPETANENKGEYILGKRPTGDGTSELDAAFVEAVITQKQPPRVAEEGYYASMLTMLGYEALVQQKTMEFPDKYKLNYLNHKAPKLGDPTEETAKKDTL